MLLSVGGEPAVELQLRRVAQHVEGPLVGVRDQPELQGPDDGSWTPAPEGATELWLRLGSQVNEVRSALRMAWAKQTGVVDAGPGDEAEASAPQTYYRWQVTKELVITPDLQLIFGSDDNTKESKARLVGGIRLGIIF